jgi:hypothetical protein
MSTVTSIQKDLFHGGPPRWLEQRLGLDASAAGGIGRSVALAVLVGWVPLALLAAAQGLAIGNEPRASFLLDPAAHARWLVAVPLLLIAKRAIPPRMSRIVQELVQTELVPDYERGRFDGIVASARRLLNSRWAEISVLIVAYLHAFVLTGAMTMDAVPTWDIPFRGGARALSLAGWWRILVSLPLYLTLSYGWLWRLLIWARFLWQVARLDLKLMPSHPDRAGGLGFLAQSAPAFSLLASAMTAAVAGKVATRVMFDGVPLQHFTHVVVALAVLILV